MMNSIQLDPYKYLEASLAGFARGAVGTVFEHPLDTIKTTMQAKPEKSIYKTCQMIHKTQGWKGYFTGLFPNALRASTKHAYRLPLMLALPPVFREILPMPIQEKYPSSIKIVTGISIATFETIPTTVFERWKIYLITSDVANRRSFFEVNKGKITSELLRGAQTVYIQKMVSWVSFLVADEKLRNWEKKRANTQELSLSSLLKVSLGVGAINTLATAPIDTIKTHLQKSNFDANEGVIKKVIKISHQHGLNGLYAGWQIKMFQYMVQSLFTVSILEKFENKNNKKS